MPVITILVADSDPVVRSCLRHVVEVEPTFQIRWEAGDGLEALHKIQMYKPFIALVDVQMPRMNGVELIKCLRCRDCSTRILLMGTLAQQAREALQAGADAFVLKDSGCEAIKNAIYRLAGLGYRSCDAGKNSASTTTCNSSSNPKD